MRRNKYIEDLGIKREDYGSNFVKKGKIQIFIERRRCGFDCDLVENYDAKITDKPLTLRQLLPMKWYKTICGDIELSALCKSPDGKYYAYCEQPDSNYGFKTLVACITDGRIVETCGYTEAEAKEIIAEVMKHKYRIKKMISDNGLNVR